MNSHEIKGLLYSLEGAYPASKIHYEAALSTWTISKELMDFPPAMKPDLMRNITGKHRFFPSLPEVMDIAREITKPTFRQAPAVDYSGSIYEGFGPTVYAGYLEGIDSLGTVKKQEELSYDAFMETHFPDEYEREKKEEGT